MKKTILTLQAQKDKNEKITMITAYEYSAAKLLDQLGVDMILVGDSLGMVVLGYEDTLSVSMKDMIHHSKAVARGVKEAFIVADLPFMSYQASIKEAVKNSAKLLKKGRANAVKLEGGSTYLPHIKAISEAGIPVMSHLGLTPQFVNVLGGYKLQGNDEFKAEQMIQDAKNAQEVGAFAVLLECVPWQLTQKITEKLTIPVIGIGAGKFCDGQVLVWHDILGFNLDFKPKFVKNFSDISEGLKAFIQEVKEGSFPDKAHSFNASKELLNKLY
ncbi:3-methyl-2-oxobutanoate hydroxymethyltransferase [Campylobacter troglodytis]|uniref:3-methyl-2-oxobutanoate hydroxymethyltransferase n=1 Tax=Campylobacter troglodytis TaxID=654363 RepID=UPI00115BDF43|nr:3-methyl-2-oxobutanoate hydroxymethyltransferase [Campylobacter troglodytis]TQR53562.1 3-methyl-2-oxobutanoate hydroxymethyltransferase [Campylobacter troglodytis]